MIELRKNRGSILIWTLLLGLSLASVFFFFSLRLNQNIATQRETIKYQNANALIESYADYLETLTKDELEAIRDSEGINFEGVTGTVTNITDEIVNTLDAETSAEYNIDTSVPGSSVTLEWNICPDEAGRTFRINGSEPINMPCAGDYQNSASFFAILNLEAPYAPVSYRLTVVDDAILYDNEWQIDLKMTASFRKTISLSRRFSP